MRAHRRRPRRARRVDRDEARRGTGIQREKVDLGVPDPHAPLIAREVELKQLNRRIDIALNNMTHGLCMFDRRGRLVVSNRRLSEIYGLPADAFLEAGELVVGGDEDVALAVLDHLRAFVD